MNTFFFFVLACSRLALIQTQVIHIFGKFKQNLNLLLTRYVLHGFKSCLIRAAPLINWHFFAPWHRLHWWSDSPCALFGGNAISLGICKLLAVHAYGDFHCRVLPAMRHCPLSAFFKVCLLERIRTVAIAYESRAPHRFTANSIPPVLPTAKHIFAFSKPNTHRSFSWLRCHGSLLWLLWSLFAWMEQYRTHALRWAIHLEMGMKVWQTVSVGNEPPPQIKHAVEGAHVLWATFPLLIITSFLLPCSSSVLQHG